MPLSKLIELCPNLRTLGDLSHWSALEASFLGALNQWAHDSNIQLDLRNHQTLKKFLDMANFERKTYLNLVTGPSIERVRRARAQQR